MPTPVSAKPVHVVKPTTTEASHHKAISPKDQPVAKRGGGDSFTSAHQTHAKAHQTHARAHQTHASAHQTHASATPADMQDLLQGTFGGGAQPVPAAPQPATNWQDGLNQAIDKVKDNFGHSLEHLDLKGGGGRAGGVIGNGW